jgi:hypothetical protein
LNYFLNPTFLLWEITKLLPPMPPKKQTFGFVPIQKNIYLSQSLKKTSFEKGWNYPILPSSPKKYPFEKEKKTFLTPHPPLFLKASPTTCNFFNLIELSTPYTL